MAVQNKTTYQANVDSLITTNGTGDISGADMNSVLKNLSDSVLHAGGGQNLGTDPASWDINNYNTDFATVTFTTDAAFTVNNIANGGTYYLRLLDCPSGLVITWSSSGLTFITDNQNTATTIVNCAPAAEVLLILNRVSSNVFVTQISRPKILDEDDLSSNSATSLATQQSIKAYVDNHKDWVAIAVSDETSDLTTGTAKATFRMPYAATLTDVRASVTTAPTGSGITVDINESGTTVLSTKLTIDATEKTSTTAATTAVISDSSIADDAEITIDIDAVGSTVAGAGLKVILYYTRS